MGWPCAEVCEKCCEIEHMKVSFLIQDLFARGAQYVTAMLIRGFVSRGYEVDLIVSQIHCDLLRDGTQGKPFDVPVKGVSWVVLPYRSARKNVFSLTRYLRRTDSRAVVVMSSNYLPALALARFFCLSTCARIYYVEHNGGIDVEFDGKTPIAPPRRWSMSWLRQKICQFPYTRFMAVSEGVAGAMAKMGDLKRNRIAVVYNPVIDESFFKKLSQSPRHPWLRERACPTFVAAGAFVLSKGFFTLFRALKELNKTEHVRLIIFGREEVPGEYRTFLEKEALLDVVSLAGFYENLPAEFKAATGFVCSSTVESFSIVIVEALASGIPVVSTDCPYGPPEILKQGRFGLLVPVGDPKRLAVAMSAVIHRPLIQSKEAWTPYLLDEVVSRYEQVMGLSNVHG